MVENTQRFWAENWRRHFSEYISYLPFQAYYLYCLLEKLDSRLLEIAGGSFHDTSALNEWGISCAGVDSCKEVIHMATKTHPNLAHKLFAMDAKQLAFQDKAFDVSFHNGFFGYFDNHNLNSLLKEQARVTKRLIVCTVHNKLNTSLINKFRQFSKVDQLYNLRFYTPDQLKELMAPFCRKVEILPFQVPEFDQIIIRTKSKDFVKNFYKQYYHTLDIGRCKRLMAVGYL